MTDDEIECRRVVFGFATERNEWEVQRYILARLAEGKDVTAKRARLVEGKTIDSHKETHRKLFADYIVPRDRKYGSQPGGEVAYCAQGTFNDVDEQAIETVTFPTKQRAEAITSWGHLSPGGKTMFVLKKQNGAWRIDSLKTHDHNGKWRPVLL